MTLPYDNSEPQPVVGGFGQARHKAFLAQLANKKHLEKEAAARMIDAGKKAQEQRERGFQNYWQGANSGAAPASRGSNGSRPKLRVAGAREVPVPMPTMPAESEPSRTRRRWDLGSPVVLRVTDGDAKGELLHVDLSRKQQVVHYTPVESIPCRSPQTANAMTLTDCDDDEHDSTDE